MNEFVGICCEEELASVTGTYIWPETSSGKTVHLTCPENANFSVSRECSDSGQWRDFDQDGCGALSPRLDSLINATSNVRLYCD